MPVYEVVQSPISEVGLKDRTLLQPVADLHTATDGCNGMSFGTTEEDPSIGWMFISWDSYEHHKALIDSIIDNPAYSTLTDSLNTFWAKGPEGVSIVHVTFEQDPTAALTAPCTEIVSLTLREGKTKDDLYATLVAFRDAGMEKEKGIHPPLTYGQTREDPNKFFLVVGWDNSKVVPSSFDLDESLNHFIGSSRGG
ncbi:hypothetical protein NLJ89_g9440 [Agrocybe chaxingu]|uniref:ABM domain-containing protein n=1 Tax=Agrocybe chaxingu TaxID=84603 RepID=A0A9W8K0K5_9AGAR|nr:hypothetical protein NLJ89_g9440 [Agrocybe chaxingu]